MLVQTAVSVYRAQERIHRTAHGLAPAQCSVYAHRARMEHNTRLAHRQIMRIKKNAAMPVMIVNNRFLVRQLTPTATNPATR